MFNLPSPKNSKILEKNFKRGIYMDLYLCWFLESEAASMIW
ncbi:unnamed protein product [Arabidopsis halleri]